jgi:hypothetical protein
MTLKTTVSNELMTYKEKTPEDFPNKFLLEKNLLEGM